MPPGIVLRRMRSAGEDYDLYPEEADNLIAPAFTQPGSDFSVGDVLRRTGPETHTKARADSDENIGIGICLVIWKDPEDPETYAVMRGSNSHDVSIPGHGLGPGFGTRVFLSQISFGKMTDVEPEPSWRLLLGYVVDAGVIHWDPGWQTY